MNKDFLYLALSLCFLIFHINADVKSTDNKIDFILEPNGPVKAILNSTGLHLDSVGSANLNVAGNALMNELSIGTNQSGSNLHIGGSYSKSFTTVTGNATLPESHSLVFLNLSSASDNVDLLLPSAGNMANRMLQIKYISGSVNAQIRSADGIDQSFRVTLDSPGSSAYPSKLSLFSSGQQWYILGGVDTTSNALLSISDNLLGHWPFDEKSGLIAHDVSGQGHHATMQGRDDVVWADGQVEGAVLLDGDNEYFFAGDQLNLNDIDFSVSYWEKRASNGSDHYVVGHGYNTTSKGLHLGFRSSDVATFAFYGNDYNSDGTYTTAEWRHWVFTYNRSSGNRTMYLNGEFLKSNVTGTPYNPTNPPLYLGANYNATSVFDGYIDDIRIYNKVLELDQIQELNQITSYTFAPVLSSATAQDTNNTPGVANGDNLILRFSEATNEPDVSTKSLIDHYVYLYNKSLGSDYTGTWSDNQTLVITITNASGADIEVGDRIKIREVSGFSAINNSSLWVHGQTTIDGLFSWFTFTDNLLAHYTFDNPDDLLIFDASGNSHLTVQGNNSFYPSGVFGNALHFEGDLMATTTGVNVSNQSQTTMLWEKRGSTISATQTQIRIGSENSNGKSFRLKYDTSNKYHMDFYGADRTTGQAYTTSEWRHWTYSFDNDLRTQRLYLNGNLILSESSDSYNFTGDTAIYLGARSSTQELNYGTIDEVRIYNRVLSQAEIQQIYHNQSAPILEPKLAKVYAVDPEFDNDGLSNGDNLTLYFSYATNTPDVTTKADLDQLIDFEDYSLGTDYTGLWSDNQTLAIRVVDATNGNLVIGGNLGILESGNLQSINGSSSNVDTSKIEILGSWGRVAAANLIAYYNLNENSGLVANDSISGNHASLDVGMDDGNWVNGYLGNGIRLDGDNDELTIAGGNFNFSNKPFAFSIWEKRANTGTEDWIFSQGSGTSNLGLHLGYRADGRYSLAFWSNDLNTSLNFTEGLWRHWVMSYDENTQSQDLYLNGELLTQRTASANYQGSGTLYIGSRFNSGSTHYEGILDEIKIYDRALTAEEVKQLYNP
jgi:hypothetical protein